MTTPTPRVDIASRVIHASPEALYNAWMDPETLARWLPPGDMTGEVRRFEPWEGGRYEMVLRYRDPAIAGKSGDGADAVGATFVELRPGERIVQRVEFDSDDPDFAGEMTMTWTFAPVRGGTEVTITAENVPPGIREEDHQAGMHASLENLARFAE
ncbi:MAG: SRPBCC family protein [Hyphomicrobiales bacterium]